MNTLLRRKVSSFQVAIAAVTVGVSLAACGSDNDKVAANTSSSGSTYEVVTDAQVTAGLAKIRVFGADIETTAKTDLETAESTYDELHEVWEEIEGTIKDKEQQTYLDLEDAMGGIKLGVQESKLDRVASGVKALNAAIDAYLAKHP